MQVGRGDPSWIRKGIGRARDGTNLWTARANLCVLVVFDITRVGSQSWNCGRKGVDVALREPEEANSGMLSVGS